MGNKRAVIVQARMSSSRFPGKSLKLIGNKPLIYYVVKRLELIGLPIIVATSTDASDDILAEYLKGQKIKVFRGSLLNVLNRYVTAAEEFRVEEIVRVTADNPLVDIEALKHALPLFKNFNYVDGIGKDGLIKGTGFELVRLSALKSIFSTKSEYLEHVTLALRERIGLENTFTSLPVSFYQSFQKEIFITCDYAEDLELLRKIFKEFNYSFDVPINNIINFYRRKPEIFKENQYLHTNNLD